MKFLDNLLRYPRFFISSIIGLVLVLTTPFFNLVKETKNKNIVILVLLLSFSTILWILNLMINVD